MGNFNIFYSQLWILGIRRERELRRRNCRYGGSDIVVCRIYGYWTRSMAACCPPRMELVVHGLSMRRLLVLGRNWWTLRRWVLGMEWQRDWSVGNSWWSGRLTGTRRMQCSCNLGTPCCGDLGRERPVGALVPLRNLDSAFCAEQFVVREEVPSSVGQCKFCYDDQVVVELVSPVREDWT